MAAKTVTNMNLIGATYYCVSICLHQHSFCLVSWVYPGSEFVVANTLAKWIKLEPNEIDFSQGFSQKLFSI